MHVCRFYCVGPTQWQFNIGANTTCPIALSDTGLLIIGDAAGVVHAIGQYTAPTPTPSPSSGGLSPGGTAAVVIVVLLVVAGVAFFAYRKWGHRLSGRLSGGGSSGFAKVGGSTGYAAGSSGGYSDI